MQDDRLFFRNEVARLTAKDLPSHAQIELRNAVEIFHRTIVANPVTHAELCAAGWGVFLPTFTTALVDALNNVEEPILNRIDTRELASGCFLLLTESWKRLHPVSSPREFLNLHIPATSGPTQEQIDSAWEVEVADSESSMRDNWEGSARTRKGKIEELGMKEPVN